MRRESLGPGDLVSIVALQEGNNSNTITALLTRDTKKYWYYYISGHPARISKVKLWRLLDCPPAGYGVRVSEASTVKKRKERRQNRTLDLHGCPRSSTEDRIRSFLNFVSLPCEIITGNSKYNKDLVESIVEEYGWACKEKDSYNTGSLLVVESV